MEDHAVGHDNRSMSSGHLEHAKLTHLVDLTIIRRHLRVESTLSTFFAVVEKEGLRELVESSFNQLIR